MGATQSSEGGGLCAGPRAGKETVDRETRSREKQTRSRTERTSPARKGDGDDDLLSIYFRSLPKGKVYGVYMDSSESKVPPMDLSLPSRDSNEANDKKVEAEWERFDDLASGPYWKMKSGSVIVYTDPATQKPTFTEVSPPDVGESKENDTVQDNDKDEDSVAAFDDVKLQSEAVVAPAKDEDEKPPRVGKLESDASVGPYGTLELFVPSLDDQNSSESSSSPLDQKRSRPPPPRLPSSQNEDSSEPPPPDFERTASQMSLSSDEDEGVDFTPPSTRRMSYHSSA